MINPLLLSYAILFNINTHCPHVCKGSHYEKVSFSNIGMTFKGTCNSIKKGKMMMGDCRCDITDEKVGGDVVRARLYEVTGSIEPVLTLKDECGG